MARALASRALPSSPPKNKVEAIARVTTARTQKNITSLHEHSFKEMLSLAGGHQILNIHNVSENDIDDGNFKTIMFTVSSSDFRLILLLHFLGKDDLYEEAWEYLQLEKTTSVQQYYDYISELGNNFCGVICRTLNAANYSTGMSTPALLTNTHTLVNLGKIGIDLGCHLAADFGSRPFLRASMCLIVNTNMSVDLDICIPTGHDVIENHGELEFF
jgi:hypothetical protein